MADRDPGSHITEQVKITDEENKTPNVDNNKDDIENIEDEEEDEKPKPKKKRDSGYTKALQEATDYLKIADSQRQRRVSVYELFPMLRKNLK